MSHFILPVLNGKSLNTTRIHPATLTHQKLIHPLPRKERLHELLDSKPFLDQMERLTTSAGKVKTGVRNVKKTTRISPSRKAADKKRTTARNPLVPSREAVGYASGPHSRLKCDDGLIMTEGICWSYWGESLRGSLFSGSLQSYQNIAVSDAAILINRVDPEF